MDLEISGKELAALLSISPRRVQQLAKDGIIAKSGRGKYFASTCIKSYIDHMLSGNGSNTQNGEIDYFKERARNEKAKADLAEIDVQRKQGELVETRVVARVVADVFMQVRTRLRDIPSRSVNTLFGLEDKRIFKKKMLIEIDDALLGLKADIEWPSDE